MKNISFIFDYYLIILTIIFKYIDSHIILRHQKVAQINQSLMNISYKKSYIYKNNNNCNK